MAVRKPKDSNASTTDREIVLTRVFDAPRELVWKAWTDPKHITQWWGPRGFTTTIHEMDLRPGGLYRHTMRGPDGNECPNTCIFREIVEPEYISYSQTGGKPGEAVATSEVAWIFEAQGDKTKLTLRMVFPSAEARKHIETKHGVIEGGTQTLDRLAEFLTKSTGRNS